MKYEKYKKYQTVGEWWENDGHGKFPVQVPSAISKLQKEKGMTFHEAFEFLVKEKVIVFVDESVDEKADEIREWEITFLPTYKPKPKPKTLKP